MAMKSSPTVSGMECRFTHLIGCLRDEKCICLTGQGEDLNIKRNWPGIACCFLLFTAVCICLTFNVQGAFIASGHPELGLLCFILPGIVASFVSRGGEVVRPLLGAILAAPICLVVMRLVFIPSRTIMQELAWLLSGVFWCALGALFFLFVRRAVEHRRETKNALRGGR